MYCTVLHSTVLHLDGGHHGALEHHEAGGGEDAEQRAHQQVGPEGEARVEADQLLQSQSGALCLQIVPRSMSAEL